MFSLTSTENVANALESQNNTSVLKEYENLISKKDNVPTFYSNTKTNPYNFITQISKENAFIKLSNELITEEDYFELSKILLSYISDDFSFKKVTLRYNEYVEFRERCPERLQKYLKSQLFLELSNNSTTFINVTDLLQYLSVQCYSFKYYKQLVLCDSNNDGFLTKEEFVTFLENVSEGRVFLTTSKGKNIQQDFITFSTTRIFLALDPLGTHSISIDHLVNSRLFLCLLQLETPRKSNKGPFSPKTVERFVSEFQNLDADNDGFLTKDNIKKLPKIKFTTLFIDRFFEVYSNDGKLDFETYLKLKLSWKHLKEPWANRIIFDVLDIDGDGILSYFECNSFYQCLSKEFQKVSNGKEPVCFEYFISETLDMCSSIGLEIEKDAFVNNTAIDQFVKDLVDISYYAESEFKMFL